MSTLLNEKSADVKYPHTTPIQLRFDTVTSRVLCIRHCTTSPHRSLVLQTLNLTGSASAKIVLTENRRILETVLYTQTRVRVHTRQQYQRLIIDSIASWMELKLLYNQFYNQKSGQIIHKIDTRENN